MRVRINVKVKPAECLWGSKRGEVSPVPFPLQDGQGAPLDLEVCRCSSGLRGGLQVLLWAQRRSAWIQEKDGAREEETVTET